MYTTHHNNIVIDLNILYFLRTSICKQIYYYLYLPLIIILLLFMLISSRLVYIYKEYDDDVY